jgi:hypothetical protein
MKTLLLLCSALIVFTSCKKCDPTNSIGGEVIEGASVKILTNAATPVMITDASQLAVPIEVSFDDQISYAPVDFSQYSVLALPTDASCSSGYDRVVTRDAANQTITYTITVTECETCEGTTRIQNWVLVPAVPASYTPIFNVK